MTELLPIRAPYLGQVATRCFVPRAKAAGPNYIRAVDMVWTRDRALNPKIGWARWISGTHEETAASGDIPFVAGIQMPDGTNIYANQCAGGAPVTFTSGSTLLLDFTVDIPANTRVKIFTLQDSTGAAEVVWRQGQAQDQSAPDCGMNGPGNGARPGLFDAFSNFSEYSYPPVCFLAQTRRPSVLQWGDSREETGTEGARGPWYDNGLTIPAIGQNFGYICLTISGSSLVQLLAATNTARRRALAAYCTHVLDTYGYNDLSGQGRTAAQLLADRATFAAQFPSNIVIGTTVPISVGTTDAHVTRTNQATPASKFAIANAGIRNGVAGEKLVLDTADAIDPFRINKVQVARDPSLSSRATACTFTASIAAGTDQLVVSAISSGSLNFGDPIIDSLVGGPTTSLCGATIIEQVSGTAGSTGTYTISRKQVTAISSRTMYVGGYALPDAIHQSREMSEQVMQRIMPAVVTIR
jgi:hypothetical protein